MILLLIILGIVFGSKDQTHHYITDTSNENFLTTLEIPSNKQSVFPMTYSKSENKNEEGLKDTELVFVSYKSSDKSNEDCLRDNGVRFDFQNNGLNNNDMYTGRIMITTPYEKTGWLSVSPEDKLIWTSIPKLARWQLAHA